ncbi:hypothetical protein M3Y94_00988500 [Aphelenchoides besseyi]|nr:hypothetical protein M3Y94_00988500 [Aphelenchoides besseyi]
MRASIVLLGLVGALAMLEMGWALKCYEGDCPSIDENCKYEIKECLPQEDACYTEKISDEGNQTIHKEVQSEEVFVLESVGSFSCSLFVLLAVKMRVSIVLLSLIGALAMLEKSEAIKCYVCETPVTLPGDSDCSKAEEEECSENVVGCETYVDKKTIMKKCGWGSGSFPVVPSILWGGGGSASM